MTRRPPAKLLASPFVASFIGASRPGDLDDADRTGRTAAWANWAVAALTEHTTDGDRPRTYPAIDLPGRFYTPGSDVPAVSPHLEIPARVLASADPTFADRLAAVGSGLRFAQWVKPEVTAAKRAIFADTADATGFLDALWSQRPALVAAVAEQLGRLRPHWDRIAAQLVADPAALSAAVTADATATELTRFAPALAAWRPRLRFEPQLAERSGDRAARRVGIWLLEAETGDGTVRLAAITPRLTASSLWNDPLFDPYGEGVAALVARGVVLSRLLAYLDVNPVAATPLPRTATPGSRWLRSQPARAGAELPHASLTSAVAFLQAYPTASAAWAALEDWATKAGAALTITRADHAAAHAGCLRALQRAEDPVRDDVDRLLPLAWVKGRVVRVTTASRDR